jgi:ABC-type sugar transport system ATPase subunit
MARGIRDRSLLPVPWPRSSSDRHPAQPQESSRPVREPNLHFSACSRLSAEAQIKPNSTESEADPQNLRKLRYQQELVPGILDGVDFEVFPGEVHVLVGENCAGKSTLMKILGGVIPLDSGEVRIAGETVTLTNAQDGRKNGVAFIHQELNLCANLDVAHNIFLGREPRRRGLKDAGEWFGAAPNSSRPWGRLDPRLPVSRLSAAQQQLVDIAKAMSFKSRVVIMDEPTASLTKREIDMLFDLIRRMRADGMGIVYISHRFEGRSSPSAIALLCFVMVAGSAPCRSRTSNGIR